MQIVIDIDKELYEEVKGYHELTECELAIFNGTVLEPHGRCVDADALIKEYGKYDIGVFVNKASTILEAWGNEE